MHREYSFLGSEHHTRAQQQPHPTLTLWHQRGSALGKQNKSILASPAVATMCHWHRLGVTPLGSSPCPQQATAPQCQGHHMPTHRQGENLDLVPSLGISSCSFLEVWQPQNCHQDSAWPSTTNLLQLSSSCYRCQELGQDGQAGSCTCSQHCNWGETGAPWDCLHSSKRAYERKIDQVQMSDFSAGP